MDQAAAHFKFFLAKLRNTAIVSLFASRRRVLFLVCGLVLFALSTQLLSAGQLEDLKYDLVQKIQQIPLPLWGSSSEEAAMKAALAAPYEPHDRHPISLQMQEADGRWQEYDGNRSTTFAEAVDKYRRQYGRHPPPGYDMWYKFARKRGVYNVDDFQQIMDDIRPFWGVPPSTIRALAARMWEGKDEGVAGIHIRDHKVVQINNPGWRVETMAAMMEPFVDHLPDMDIAMNSLDQPRVTVPWRDMQQLLANEVESRQLHPEAPNSFSPHLPGLFEIGRQYEESREEVRWVRAPGKQYMDIARTACAPDSHANGGMTTTNAEKEWKNSNGGIVTNFNLSSDLCTAGPEIQTQHGFLYASTSLLNSYSLVPIFGECKVNVNSDILFPANMYWRHDQRYVYDGKHDLDWEKKAEEMIWRGVTSGGIQTPDNWRRMHRQRLVMAMNATVQADATDIRIAAQQAGDPADYRNFEGYKPSNLLEKVSDVGFVEEWGCEAEDCSFYNDVFTLKPQTSLADQFATKFLVDVDGHSFSGRWRAFLQSKSLGIKATIFREWHDSRLFAWRHFVPLDNRYDDIYTILTYFIGIGSPAANGTSAHEPVVERHDFEAKRLALQGRDWAAKVLRTEDIEIYMFRLLLEYGRIIDDNRDVIGYSGDGSELERFDKTWS